MLAIIDGEVHHVDSEDTTGFAFVGGQLVRALQPDSLRFYGSTGSQDVLLEAQLGDVHDVLVADDDIYVVGTQGNAVARVSLGGEVVHRWAFGEQPDAQHVNCLASWNGRIVYSAFGDFSTSRGYKEGTRGTGYVRDLLTGKLLVAGLSQPHSLVPFGDNLILANSEDHEIAEYDADGRKLRSCAVGGYTRGICVVGNVLYVGLSAARHMPNPEESRASILALDATSWEPLGRLPIPVREVYSICHAETPDALATWLARISTDNNARLTRELSATRELVAQGERQRQELEAALATATSERISQADLIATLTAGDEALREARERNDELANTLAEQHADIAALNARLADAAEQERALRNQIAQDDAPGLRQQVMRLERHATELRTSIEQQIQEAEAARQAPGPTPNPWRGRLATLRSRGRRAVDRVRDVWVARLAGRATREFDPGYYLQRNPDVAAAGIDPFEHYLRTGWKEGRDPSPGFSTEYYLATNPDVRARHVNPLLHYVGWGRLEGRKTRPDDISQEPGFVDLPAVPVPLLDAPPPAATRARVIAFYLPQFHAIPENDAWWGKGFTEWTNVRAAAPLFDGHYQPHVPGELGYYNLLDTSVQRRQIELAKLYGIEGFCFYFYWFGGKRLLEKPVENWLADPSLDLPFCVCWANENWTRRWDGQDRTVLIAQQHSDADDLAFIEAVAPYMRDPRYIRVDGRPILLVYRPSLLPSAKQTAARWRQWCRDNGIGEIHLAYTQSFESVDPATYGFDAAIEFPPNNSHPPELTKRVLEAGDDSGTRIYDWRVFEERSHEYRSAPYTLYRSVCPSWDNSARRKRGGGVFVNNTPGAYRSWLANAVTDTETRFADPQQRLVFVNAWNEWAEGAHLEPDERFGYAWLQATRDAVEAGAAARPRIVVVSHDAHPHGAQYLAMHMARGMGELGFDVDMIVLGEGPMLPRFAEVATVHRFDLGSESGSSVLERLRALRAHGAEVALSNTTVSGPLVPLLKEAGFQTVSLIHEMPGILEDYGLDRAAGQISEHADKVVFPAAVVREGFEQFVGSELEQATIRPQGLYSRTPFRTAADRDAIRRDVRARLGLEADAGIIFCAGYGDYRKGLDLFVDASIQVLGRVPNATAVWAGNVERKLHEAQLKKIRAAGLGERFFFPGHVDRPQDYFSAADVYALTSREDPFPSVVLESLDAATPVVAFDGTGGAAELLRRDCGILVPAFDTQQMAAALERLLVGPIEASRLGLNGRDLIERDFSLRHYLHDLLALAGRPLPRVSVVVPNYNYARYLPERLASIAAQTFAPYELIVLDDASTDDSVEVIREYLKDCPIPSRVVVNEKNSGSVFRQWQRGVQLARGDFVWIAEADDLADPGLLSRLLTSFDRPGVVMSYCQSRQMNGEGQIMAEDYLDYVADIDSERWTRPYVENGREEIRRALHVKNTVPNVSAVLFRTQPLRETLDRCAQEIVACRHTGDWVTYLRLLEKGDIAFWPQALNSHRRHASSVTLGNLNLRQLQEIIRVQRQTARRFHLGPAAEFAASRYSQELYEQFGLATAEHPLFRTNPDLTPAPTETESTK